MQLTVLGGSAAGPNTGQGCSGYYVEGGDTRLVLDLGPGTLPELRRHTDYRSLTAVVLSHLHADHVLDLVALRYALSYNPIKPSAPIRLWMPPGGTAFMDQLAAVFATGGYEPEGTDRFFSAVYDIAEYDPDLALHIGDLRLTFAPTVHYVPCWAIRVGDGQSDDLVYTADTGPAARLEGFAQGAGVVVAEATYPDLGSSPEPWEERGHLTAREAGELAASAGANVLILTHLWEECGFDVYRDQAANAFAGRIETARPGLTITW